MNRLITAPEAAPVSEQATGEEGVLSGYRREKLELADCLLTLMHVAESRHDDDRAGEIRSLAARLAEDRFQLAVVGQFSRGKSTLMNAILGADFLPTGALPMTSIITTVVYGSTKKATIRRKGSLMPIDTALEDLPRYVAQASSEREELQVASALIELPAEILRLGLSFVDTPGVGSAIVANTETTLGFLPEADAVVFVTSFDSPLTESEISFLHSIRSEVKQIFVVLNKRDLVSDSEASDVATYVASKLTEVGIENPSIFELSAREGLAAKLRGDPAMLRASGVAALEAELVLYLTTEKAREFLLRVSGRTERALDTLSSEAALANALECDEPARAKIERALDGLVDHLDEKRGGRLASLAEVATEQLDLLERTLLPEWIDELSSLLLAGRALAEAPRQRAHLQAKAGELDTIDTKRSVDAWSEQALSGWLRSLEEQGGVALVALSNLPTQLESEFAHELSTPSGDRSGAEKDRPRLIARRVGWETPILRPAYVWSRARARARLERTVGATAQNHVRRLVETLRESVNSWSRDLESWSSKELRDAEGRIRTRLATPGDTRLEAELSTLRDAILASRARVMAWSITSRGDGHERVQPLRGAAPSERGAGCVVCSRLVRSLFEFMAHYQLELATRFEQRLMHASTNGFCAAHTWYYAEIGSPVGVSAAYARLGESTASVLTAAALNAGDLVALRRALAAAHCSIADCPACVHLREVEGEALSEVRSGLEQSGRSPTVPPLCLDHVERLLVNDFDAELARQIVAATARRLRRRSEDMRTYSLKRESMRRTLVDKEEEAAYRDVLLRLVGDPLLVSVARSESELSSPYRKAGR